MLMNQGLLANSSIAIRVEATCSQLRVDTQRSVEFQDMAKLELITIFQFISAANCR